MKIICRFFVTFLFLFAIGHSFDIAEARPGGGHSSSSHSSSRSSSSRGSSWGGGSYYRGGSSSINSYGNSHVVTMSEAEFFFAILVIAILIIVLINLRRDSSPKTVYSARTEMIRSWSYDQLTQAFVKLRQADPNFSKILLIDFVHSLYTKFYSYTGQPEFSYLSPFLSEQLQTKAELGKGIRIDEVVINAIHWQEVNLNDPLQDSIVLMIDANYTQHLQGKNTRYIVTERWKLSRDKNLLSLEPKKMQSLSCPYCAAPAHFNDAGVCPYCKNVLHQGNEQWFVKQRVVIQTSILEASGLVTYAQEQGTDLMTLKAPDLAEQLQVYQQTHQIQDWDNYWQTFKSQIVESYFVQIYQHWSQRDWNGVRHLLSDRLYEANQFWTDRYEQQNWFNRLEKLKIDKVILTKIDLDKFYESVTVRIFASCFDYTENAQGKLIGGSKRELRKYSEYWTFVRRSGIDNNQNSFNLGQCPHCGAPADQMGQAGECGYCGSKISTGEFSWVLFLIMQDDAYSG